MSNEVKGIQISDTVSGLSMEEHIKLAKSIEKALDEKDQRIAKAELVIDTLEQKFQAAREVAIKDCEIISAVYPKERHLTFDALMAERTSKKAL